eukprot:gene17233-5342_t
MAEREDPACTTMLELLHPLPPEVSNRFSLDAWDGCIDDKSVAFLHSFVRREQKRLDATAEYKARLASFLLSRSQI